MPVPMTVDQYLASKPEPQRTGLATMRATIRAAAPDADEVITYKMPGFKTHGRFLVSYDAFKAHYSLFPASQAVIARFPSGAGSPSNSPELTSTSSSVCATNAPSATPEPSAGATT